MIRRTQRTTRTDTLFPEVTSFRSAFLHSHSYSGKPLACAAAIASLDIFESDDVITRNRDTAAKMAKLAAPFANHPLVTDVRQAGMIVAIELQPEPGGTDRKSTRLNSSH